MFAGIGGFRSGLEAAGGFRCVGYCEIDPYPRRAYEALYDTGEEVFYQDARTIDPVTLPDLDLICGGFPCQSFSIAGRRGGFADTRGTLFFEIARIAEAKRPRYLLLENVPGLLSHDEGRTFATILRSLDELGYDVAWQVLNSKDFGVPQSRNRVYIVGYLRDRCAGEILAFDQASPSALSEIGKHYEGSRVYDSNGISCTLAANCGGFGGKTGMYAVPIKCRTRLGYQMALIPDRNDGIIWETGQTISTKIHNLMMVLSAYPDIEIVCTDSRECFDENKVYLQDRLEEERNPMVQELLKKDIDFLSQTLQAEMARARQFLFLVRCRNQKPEQVFRTANDVEMAISKQGFETRRLKKPDIKRLLAVCFETGMNGDAMPDIDGEQYIEEVSE
jgi:DNA-cytosine methyltransferase